MMIPRNDVLFKFVVEFTFILQNICLKRGFGHNGSQIDNKIIETTKIQNKDLKFTKTTKMQTQDSQKPQILKINIEFLESWFQRL